MSWREIDRDDRYRVPFVVYRCRGCGKMAVSTNRMILPSKCGCSG